MKCKICNNEVVNGENIFPFPELPETHRYSGLHGMVHVKCLREHPDTSGIGEELGLICSSMFGETSDYPVVLNANSILMQDRRPDECYMIYNFRDFVQFHIPYSQVKQVQELSPHDKMLIGINGLLELSVQNNGSLMLEQKKPFSQTLLPSLSLNDLKEMLNKELGSEEKK